MSSSETFPVRVSWDAMWSGVALVVATRSFCVRDQVGAVIVDCNNRIIATGYNGPPAGFEHNDQPCTMWCERNTLRKTVKGVTHTLAADYADCPSLHAEANALMVCDRREREGGKIYVTSEVCYTCAKLIANSGLNEVVVFTGGNLHRDPEKSYTFLESCGVTVVRVGRE